MENSKKRTVIDVLLVFTCFVVITSIAYHFYQQNQKKEAAYAQEYALKEQVVWDLYYHYENLKDFAASWNSDYAKLSLNSNRDTIIHPKYTVKEFTRLHYKYRGKLYTQAKELNNIYVALANNIRTIDSIETSYNTASKFYSYFSCLRQLDKVIYELLSDEYPRSLKYAVSVERDFTLSAKNRLFSTQVSNLRMPSEYRVYTPEALNLKQNMMACLGEETSQINNLEFEVNQGKALLLVFTDTLKNESLEPNRISKNLSSCYATMKKDYDRMIDEAIEAYNKAL